MSARVFLLPGGTWTLLMSASPDILPDGTVLIDPWETNPGRRVMRLNAGTWTAVRDDELDELYRSSLEPDRENG